MNRVAPSNGCGCPLFFVCSLALLLLAPQRLSAAAFSALDAEKQCYRIDSVPADDQMGHFVRRWILDISNAIHYEPTFEICAVDDFNLSAMFRPPRLVYGRAMIGPMMSSPRTNWEAIAVLSHEIGHLVMHQESSYNTTPLKVTELQADEFAGYVLAALGVPEATLDVFLKYGDSETDPHVSHGTGSERRAAALRGWKKQHVHLPYYADYVPYKDDVRYWISTSGGFLGALGAAGVVVIGLIGCGSWASRRFREFSLRNVRVFISYRREDTAGHTGRIYDALKQAIPERNIFMDVTAISPGEQFPDAIQAAISKCDVLISVIGRTWLTCRDELGRRRLDNDDDTVRSEIAAALRAGIVVVPVLVDGALMPAKDALPDPIAQLASTNAVEIRHTRFEADIKTLSQIVAQAPSHARNRARMSVRDQRVAR